MGIVQKHMLSIHAIVDGNEIEICVAVEVHRLKIVVVGELRQSVFRGVNKHPGAVILKEKAAFTPLAGNEDIEVIIVVNIDQLKLPGEFDQTRGHVSAGSIGEMSCTIVEP